MGVAVAFEPHSSTEDNENGIVTGLTTPPIVGDREGVGRRARPAQAQ
jgi:hypothetical protein